MKLTVAGNTKEYDEGLTVAKLLEVENVEMPLYVTVSLNDEFLSQESHATTVLKVGDKVEFFYFMGGGQ